ncbi:zinc finger protein 227-like [Macrosteles quadrilineatus]|uniref:zinc finger protein 227-like n=1 Tax=Macrosteles quadrilineatus TaxID=74068 RepID=UPI0023E28672|nr:zinc finger protein 227-like [Macrosteles quadrilineatus]XP_054269353.1 zinc finger protein 227-like [Macrosteles quadrilineatus]XP_054269354.1 zinc finger protein 227-like [Macrosteles quadrilineatus]
MESQPMCPVCTLYLRPGMSLHDHLYTHPKDQVIEALVRLAATGTTPSATINTNSQFTAITYRQFQTLTTSVPESSIPMMINPCQVINPPTNTPFTPGVIRSSVPLVSYPYYPQEQPTNLADHDRNTQCTYSLATQTTQTTQTNSPLVTHTASPFQEGAQNTSPFQEATCEESQEIDEPTESFEPAIDPFTGEQEQQVTERESFAGDVLPEGGHESREIEEQCLIMESKMVGIHKNPDSSVIESIRERSDDPFDNEDLDNINESELDPFVEDRIEEIHGDESECRDNTNNQIGPEEDDLMDPTHSLGTVISNTHRLIANEPGLDYDDDLRTNDYNESYGNFSPTRNIVSPSSDVSNWSGGSGNLRVRRDLSSFDEHGNMRVLYVHPNSNATEFVTSDPYGAVGRNQSSEAQLTNLDDVNYSMVLNYSNNQLANMSVEDGENKEDNSEHSTPLNIHSDELMPPRGELSGQESLGATENSVWELQDHGEPSTASYPLLEKDRWQIMGSTLEDEINESHSNGLENRNHSVKCFECDMRFVCVRERRIHVQTVHNTPRHTQVKTEESTSRLLTKSDLKSQIIKIKQERGLPVKTEASLRTCVECGMEMLTVKELRKHRREFHELKRKCDTCNTLFSDSLAYKEHIAKIHPIECVVCGKFFPNKSAANTHAKCHLKLKPYQCTMCDKSFLSRLKLNEHTNIHSGESPYKCTLCNQTFKRQSNLIQHKNFFHLKMKKKVKDYFCHCGEIFHSIKKLQWHKEIHDTKPKQCMYCSERYVHSTSLTRHIRHAHDNTYLPKTARAHNVLCPICKITCVRSSLGQHMKIHSADKSYTCNVCSKEFSTNWNLQMHKWTHASRNSKPFKCKQCKCAFYMLSSFQAHVRSHRNIRPYTCNYCGRQFIRKYNCIRHVKEHETTKSYCCAVCNKTFHRSYYLTEHMRTHTGVKPYTCHICSKTSSTKSNHNKHVRTHHAREPVNTEG